MSEIWAVIVLIILAMVIYAWFSSRQQANQKQTLRAATVPYVKDNLTTGTQYNIHLSDGRLFSNIEIIGSPDPEAGHYSFSGWQSMLVLKQASGKRIFLKQESIRFIEEV